MPSERRPDLTVYEQVLCLECAHRYVKPGGGGTSRDNPGCPRCGYVGWISVRCHSGRRSAGPLRETG